MSSKIHGARSGLPDVARAIPIIAVLFAGAVPAGYAQAVGAPPPGAKIWVTNMDFDGRVVTFSMLDDQHVKSGDIIVVAHQGKEVARVRVMSVDDMNHSVSGYIYEKDTGAGGVQVGDVGKLMPAAKRFLLDLWYGMGTLTKTALMVGLFCVLFFAVRQLLELE